MCGNHLRNGMSTDTPIHNSRQRRDLKDTRGLYDLDQASRDELKNKESGRHETWFDYNNCVLQSGQSKYGFECPDERNQYPYSRRKGKRFCVIFLNFLLFYP